MLSNVVVATVVKPFFCHVSVTAYKMCQCTTSLLLYALTLSGEQGCGVGVEESESEGFST